jgi:hypothetical protein
MPTLPDRIAAQAEQIVDNHTETHYTHVEKIAVATGIYDCDCSEFVGFVLEQVAPDHYAPIVAMAPPPRPLAFDYFTFFSNLTPESAGGWSRIDALGDARRGDIVAWRAPEIKPHRDTGHCFFVAETPATLADSAIFAVRVYDSAAAPHFDDARADGKTGVGTGFINFKVDGEGRPVAFQFGPAPDNDSFVSWEIAIGRVR